MRRGTIVRALKLWIVPMIVSGFVDLGTGKAGAARELIVCAPDAMALDCDYNSIARAAEVAEAGDTLVLRPGTYREAAVLKADNLRLRAEPGAHMVGVAVENKAALVVKGDNTVIEGLECSGISVSSGNGACVRAEGLNLTLRGVHFHDSQEGILGGHGRIVIEDSLFEHLGGDRETGIGRAHGIYIGRNAEEFILRRSRILASKEEGHEVKSRALRTVIEDNVIASLNGVDSRQIDIPYAGEVVIRRNVIQKGPRSSNAQFIGIGLELGRDPEFEAAYAKAPARIEDNLFINDYPSIARLVKVENAEPAEVVNNTVVGMQPEDLGDNAWSPTRRSAGLAPFPSVPAAPPS